MEKRHIKLGSRGSQLALWQANFLKDQLEQFDLEVEIEIIKTQGDKIQDIGFDKMEGKGFFTKEIEEALLAGQIDMAVHSMKDMPTESHPDLAITATSDRVDPADWMLIHPDAYDETQILKIKQGAKVGTSSSRRKAQMKSFRSDLHLTDLRGNVPTRINKLKSGDYDGILLAAAGLIRLELDLSFFKLVKFNPKEFVPAPAQGVLAYQCRKDDLDIRRILKQVHHPEVAAKTNIERKVLNLMSGSCLLPIGVYCEQDSMNHYHVWAVWAEDWDQPMKHVQISQSSPVNLAEKVAQQLKEK